jgi:hypothetical protein
LKERDRNSAQTVTQGWKIESVEMPLMRNSDDAIAGKWINWVRNEIQRSGDTEIQDVNA